MRLRRESLLTFVVQTSVVKLKWATPTISPFTSAFSSVKIPEMTHSVKNLRLGRVYRGSNSLSCLKPLSLTTENGWESRAIISPILLCMRLARASLMSQTRTQSSLSFRDIWRRGAVTFAEGAAFYSSTVC